MPGSVTEPIQERHRPLTCLADNASARKPLGEAEDPPPLAQHVGGHPLLDTNLLRIWLCPDPMAHGNPQALLAQQVATAGNGFSLRMYPPRIGLGTKEFSESASIATGPRPCGWTL